MVGFEKYVSDVTECTVYGNVAYGVCRMQIFAGVRNFMISAKATVFGLSVVKKS